jgi:hypothetical protein
MKYMKIIDLLNDIAGALCLNDTYLNIYKKDADTRENLLIQEVRNIMVRMS